MIPGCTIQPSRIIRGAKIKPTGEIMFIQKLRYLSYGLFIGSLLFALAHGASAQDRSQPAGKTAGKENKESAESCDGAIDIVPVKSMTFTRKRRLSRTEAKTDTKSDVKSDGKPDARPDAKSDARTESPSSSDAKTRQKEKQGQDEGGRDK